MNEIQKAFEHFGHSVRTLLVNDDVWFVAKDVCEILEIKDVSNAVNGNPTRGDAGIDDDEKDIFNVSTPGGMQKMLCVSEPGLYGLIFKSRKPEAEAFRRWIAHDVLPSIRKTGMYSVKTLSVAELHLLTKQMLDQEQNPF